MSGPIPAGSPRVSASGRAHASSELSAILDHALGSAVPSGSFLRLRLELLAEHVRRALRASRGRVGADRRLLAADRENLDPCGVTRAASACRRRVVEHFALLLARDRPSCAMIGSRTATSRSAAREPQAFLAGLEARAQGLGLALARLEGGRRRAARHDEQDRPQAVVVAGRSSSSASPQLDATSFSPNWRLAWNLPRMICCQTISALMRAFSASTLMPACCITLRELLAASCRRGARCSAKAFSISASVTSSDVALRQLELELLVDQFVDHLLARRRLAASTAGSAWCAARCRAR